ncbi:hypothetical protein IT408_02860 [Candidatus Uhrbacteria bacterium]|nr:hypothetical protein [Candidatus Uhrbacteria bacterium]
MSYRIFALCSLVISAPLLFGMGCRPRPRIVQAPSVPVEKAQEPSQTDESIQGVLAYANLAGARADLIRDGSESSVQDGQALAEGDQIKVTNGTLELIYPDAGISQVSAGSEIVLLAQNDAPRDGEVSAEIELIAGNIWTRF